VKAWRRYQKIALLGLFLAGSLHADSTLRAAAELQRVRELVQAGALPRSALHEAEQALEDARGEQTLEETLLQRELTVEQLPPMLAAATMLRDRARERFSKSRELVEAGALPANRLQEAKDALGRSEKQYELAESRARIVRELAAMARTEERIESPETNEEQIIYPIRQFC
jgi:multidrug resistance efflux pump